MSENGVFVFNPLPWDRELSGLVAKHVVKPRGVPTDETAGRHFQDRDLQRRPVSGFTDDDERSSLFTTDSYYLPKTTVSGYGYTVIPREQLESVGERSFDERSIVETEQYVLTFDRERGGITSWYDKERNHEWVASDADQPLAGFVHEEVADNSADRPRKRLFNYGQEVEDHHAAVAGILDTPRGFQPDWHAHRSGPEGVRRHRVYEMPEGYEVRQVLATPQVESDVTLGFVLPRDGDTVIIDAQWDMGLRTHPEATYLAFPFNIKNPTPRLDIGGHAIEPGKDQLAESVYDYYTVQHWADISDEDRGMTVGCPLNPMVQFGDFCFAANQRSFDIEQPLLLSWVTNNYWETNFRAHQPGRVRARYHLSPHDEFDEAAAHRAGMEAAHYQPLTQTLGEGTVDNPPLSESGQLLDLPEPPILVVHIRPITADTGIFHPGAESPADREEEILLSLRNASDRSQTFRIGTAELRLDATARTDPTGQIINEDLTVTDGEVKGVLERRATATLKLEASLNA